MNIAHVTPHAWALDGFEALIRDRGSVIDVLPELAVSSRRPRRAMAASPAIAAGHPDRRVSRGPVRAVREAPGTDDR